jgi:PHP family Zn ribbon phosphoesterase
MHTVFSKICFTCCSKLHSDYLKKSIREYQDWVENGCLFESLPKALRRIQILVGSIYRIVHFICPWCKDSMECLEEMYEDE